MFDPLIILPGRIELFNEIPYGIFRLNESLSSISVEVILSYPFERFEMSSNGKY